MASGLIVELFYNNIGDLTMDLINLNNEITMTLKEITDLLEVRHDNAMNVVAKMVENLDFGTAPIIQEQYIKGNGAVGLTNTYQLNKRQSIAVAAKLNTSLLMRIIDRWQELESRMVEHKLPTNFVEALEMLVVAEKDKLLLQAKIDKDAPLVGMANMLMEADVGIKLQEFARIQSDETGLGRNKLYKFLRDCGIIDKRNKPFQRCIDAEWFYIIERPFSDESFSGINHIVMVTPKGQKYLVKRLQEIK